MADIDTIQWLLYKRQRAVELRERLIKDAVTRFRNYCAELAIEKLKNQPIPTRGKPDFVDDVPSAQRERQDQLESLREHGTDYLKSLFFVVPTFPRDPLVSLDDLYNWGRYLGEGARVLFDFIRYEFPAPIPGGVRIIEPPSSWRHPYVELNQFGLCCSFMEYEEKDEASFRPRDVAFQIHHSLKIASAFYQWLGFQGSLSMRVELTEALWKSLVRKTNMEGPAKHTAYPPTIVTFEKQLYATDFHSRADALYEEICRNVFWAFGWKAPEGWLKRPQS